MKPLYVRSLLFAWLALSCSSCLRFVPSPPSIHLVTIDSWQDHNAKESIAGVDVGKVLGVVQGRSVQTAPTGAHADVLVWVDFGEFERNGQSSNMNGESTMHEAFTPHRDAEDAQLQRIEIDAAIKGTNALDFRINGHVYDLDKGKLFLVSTIGTAPRILQLDESFRATPDSPFSNRRVLAAAHPSILRFFTEAHERALKANKAAPPLDRTSE